MGQELTQANETLLEFERLIQSGGCNAWEGTLRTGVDLGTANIGLAVVDEQNRPVAGVSYSSTVVRDGIVVHEGVLGSLQRFKDSVKEVKERFECGLTVEKFNDIKLGDIIEAYTMEEVPR